MSTREKAPSILTEVGARRLTARIRDALVIADDLLADALAGRAWEALGYSDWAAYCEAEIPALRHIKLRTPERRARTKALLEADPTVTERAIAAATGASAATAHRDVLAVTGREVASFEASPETPQATPPVQMPKTDRTVALVAAQGDRGLTCLELEHETGWRHGVASGPVSTVARQGRIRATGRFREGYGVYVAC